MFRIHVHGISWTAAGAQSWRLRVQRALPRARERAVSHGQLDVEAGDAAGDREVVEGASGVNLTSIVR